MSRTETNPTVETLSGPPSLATTFLKAVLTGRGKSGKGELPQAALELAVTVERDHLTSYQRVCGWDLSDALPHTYPHVLGFPLQASLMAGSDFPLPMAGLVHVEDQPADALVLRGERVGAHQQLAEVGDMGPGAPDLLA